MAFYNVQVFFHVLDIVGTAGAYEILA